jgi:hypothetical protein
VQEITETCRCQLEKKPTTKNQTTMSNLTDAQEKDYTRQITGILNEYKDEMIANNADPTQRITNLVNGATATDAAEAAEVKAEAAKVAAIALTTTLRETNYKLAQASVGLIEGALGKDHPAAVRARGIRSSMSHTTADAPPAPTP